VQTQLASLGCRLQIHSRPPWTQHFFRLTYFREVIVIALEWRGAFAVEALLRANLVGWEAPVRLVPVVTSVLADVLLRGSLEVEADISVAASGRAEGVESIQADVDCSYST